MAESKKSLSLRATFEDTRTAQKELRGMLDKLIEEDRPLKGAEERTKFLDLIDRANLGLESHQTAVLKTRGIIKRQNNEDEVCKVVGDKKNLAKLIEEIAYEHRAELEPHWVSVPNSPTERARVKLSNADLWKWLRSELFLLWPRARELALKVSVEKEPGDDTRIFKDNEIL